MKRLAQLSIYLLFWMMASAHAASPNLSNTQKVSFIFVGPSKGLSESSFGHAALKLSPTKEPGLLDVVVEFVAEIPPGEASFKKYIKGMGLGKRYPVFTSITSFYDFKKIKTINEDRPLEIYELDLSQDEISRVINFIQNFQNHVDAENYSFFKKNCAYFSTLAIEKSIGKKIHGKSLPWKGPEEFKKHGLISKSINYAAASDERVRYAKKFLADGLEFAFPDPSWAKSFTQSLKEPQYIFRFSSYLKLLWVLQNPRHSSVARKKAMALFRYLVSYEEDSTAFILKEIFKSPEQKRVIPSKILDLTSESVFIPPLNAIRYELKHAIDHLRIDLSWINPMDNKKVRIPIPFRSLQYTKETGIISFFETQLGRFIPLKNDLFFLGQRLDYAIDLDKDEGKIRVFMYVDKSDHFQQVKKEFDYFKNVSKLAINNSKDFSGELGNCYAMTLLQKAFFERAIFLPDQPSNPDMKKVEILSSLIEGNYVVIPGYSNVEEFTQSMDKELLRNWIRHYQKLISKNPLHQAYENLTQRQELNSSSLRTFQSLLDDGVLIPLIIGMTEKNSRKIASPLAHVVLVMGMDDIGDGRFKLTIYDPNTNINNLMILEKDFRLTYPFFLGNYDFRGMIDKLDKFGIELDNAVRSREINYEFLSKQMRNGMSLVIPPEQIFGIFK